MVIKPHSNDITIPASATNNANKNTPNTTKAFNLHCLKFFYQILLLFSQRWPNKMTEFLICLGWDLIGCKFYNRLHGYVFALIPFEILALTLFFCFFNFVRCHEQKQQENHRKRSDRGSSALHKNISGCNSQFSL